MQLLKIVKRSKNMQKINIGSTAILAGVFMVLYALIGDLFFQWREGDNNDIKAEKTYEIKVIDSCEYIYVSRRPWAGDFSLTHKGNCIFCAARQHSR
jgi:hypothetical protein